MRLLGTSLGGFAGWLALVVCSGFASHIDADTDINKYGLAAWLTTVTIVVAYFSIGDGLAAQFGPGSSAAKVEIWFVLTMVIVSLEVEAGKGHANDIVANRVVATATGEFSSSWINCHVVFHNRNLPMPFFFFRGHLLNQVSRWRHW